MRQKGLELLRSSELQIPEIEQRMAELEHHWNQMKQVGYGRHTGRADRGVTFLIDDSKIQIEM